MAPLVHVDDGKTHPNSGLALGGSAAYPAAGPTTNLLGSGRLIGDAPSAQAAKAPAPDDGIVLNVVNLPIAQAAKVVLGDILSVNFIVDPKVDGKITVHTTSPIARSEVVSFFDSALRLSNAAIVQSGDIYKVVPLDQSVGSEPRVNITEPGQPAQAVGAGLHVVQLKYVSASEMKRVIDSVVPKGVVRADDSRDVLTLSGGDEESSLMMNLINVFDVDTMRGMSFGIVPVRTTDPDAMADELRTVFGSNKEGPMNGMVRFIGNKRLGSIMVISPQSQYIARAEDWIRRLDARAEQHERQMFTYSVQNRSAKELVDILNSMFSSDAANGAKPGNVAPRATPASLSSPATASIGQGGAPFGGLGSNALQPANSVTTSGLGNSPSASLAAEMQNSGDNATTGQSSISNLDAQGSIKISLDEENNSLIVMATPEEYKRIHRIIQGLDVVPNQVLIEATIAEVTLTDDMQFGVRWYLQNSKNGTSATFTNDAAGAVSSVFPGFSYAIKAAGAQATLNALNAVTTVNVISSPSLTVLDNRTATLQVGDEVPVITQSAVNVETTTGAVVNSVSYVNTGVILSITPRINDSGRVLLDIEQEVSSVAQTTSSSIDSPTIQQRKIKTSVLLNDSQSLTLGGLIQDQKTLTKSQVPLLGDIPLIGNAFKSKDDTISKTELLIIITPRVVRNFNEAEEVTDEYRRKLSVYLPNSPDGPPTFQQNVRRVFQ